MILDITEFAVKNNASVGVSEAIKQLKNGDTLYFPKGEYHFYKDYCQSRNIHMTNTDSFRFPKKYFAMLFENKNGVTLDGGGSVFVMHGDICALAAIKCENMTFKNFTVKHAMPTNIELTVKENRGLKVVYQLPSDTTWYVKNNKAVFFEQSPFTKQNYWQFINNQNSTCAVIHDGKFVCRSTVQPFTAAYKVKQLSADTLEIKSFIKKKYKQNSTVTMSQCSNRDCCGLFFTESKNIVSENITVNYMHGFGWLTQMCENVSFDSIRFLPMENHCVSAFADCIHVCGCKGGVNINNCYFTQPHDDGINIHGAFLRVRDKLDDNTVVLEFVHRQQGGYTAFYPGDKVYFYYRSDLQRCGGDFTVKSVKDNINDKSCEVCFEEKLPDDIECKFLNQNNVVAENITYCPDVEIKNCTFTAIPTRGILCTTCGHVDIHHNSFDNTQMANIYISNDANDWYESGPVADMLIHDNNFDIPKSSQKEWSVTGAVFVDPITLGGKVDKPIHKNIRIYNNKMNIENGYALYSKGAENITIDDTEHKVVIK